MKNLQRVIIALFLVVVGIGYSSAQNCRTWNDLPNKSEVEGLHSIYRTYLKGKTVDDLSGLDAETFKLAFDSWKSCYELAPAADGNRDWHYTDGAKLYLAMIKKDPAKKETYAPEVIKLYEEAVKCILDGNIQIKAKGFTSKQFAGKLLGDLGFHMFYALNSPYETNLDVFTRSMELAGNNTLYNVFDPIAMILVYQFKNKQIDAEAVRRIHKMVADISEYNFVNNERLGKYYSDAFLLFESKFKEIESDVFDCEYFKEQLLPEYYDNKNDLDVIKYVFNKLKNEGCDPEEEIMIELKAKYETMAAELNEQMEAEFLANNPGVAARRLYDEGRFKEAIEKYREAISKEKDNVKKAEYYFGIASIQYRKLRNYNAARTNALKAASHNKNWGRPYMLIGDMYAASSRNCGNDAYTRGLAVLAAIDKYEKARSVDASVAAEARNRINKYRKSIPPKDEVFMRSMQGKTDKVPCWIGETVKVRHQQ
jgi:tetratricopeptide (TPR) repeat protein